MCKWIGNNMLTGLGGDLGLQNTYFPLEYIVPMTTP